MQLTATPYATCQFQSWGGALSGILNPQIVVMDADRSVTAAFSCSVSRGPLRLVAVSPCRVSDTRAGEGKTGPFGPPTLAALTTRTIPIPAGSCGIPTEARAYSLNITVVPAGPLSYLTVWPAGQPQPLVSTLNSFEGRVRANAAIVPAGAGGAINVFVTNATDLIIDINGYFAP